MCTIPKHAEDRLRERTGLPKRAIRRYVNDAQQYGKSRAEVNGDLRRYLDKKYQEYYYKYNGRQYCRIKGNTILWFVNDTLITVMIIRYSMAHNNRQQCGF